MPRHHESCIVYTDIFSRQPSLLFNVIWNTNCLKPSNHGSIHFLGFSAHTKYICSIEKNLGKSNFEQKWSSENVIQHMQQVSQLMLELIPDINARPCCKACCNIPLQFQICYTHTNTQTHTKYTSSLIIIHWNVAFPAFLWIVELGMHRYVYFITCIQAKKSSYLSFVCANTQMTAFGACLLGIVQLLVILISTVFQNIPANLCLTLRPQQYPRPCMTGSMSASNTSASFEQYL